MVRARGNDIASDFDASIEAWQLDGVVSVPAEALKRGTWGPVELPQGHAQLF